METIVPGLHGSGRNDKSCNGLPSPLAASGGGELAIAGTVGACSAGLPTLNAPAKEYGEANLASSTHIGEEEEKYSPARLRRGGKRPINMPLFEPDGNDQPEEKADEAVHQAVKQGSKGRQEGRNNEPTPGPSKGIKSRSPIGIKTRSQRREPEKTAVVQDDDSTEPIGDSDSERSNTIQTREEPGASRQTKRKAQPTSSDTGKDDPQNNKGGGMKPPSGDFLSSSEEDKLARKKKKKRKKGPKSTAAMTKVSSAKQQLGC